MELIHKQNHVATGRSDSIVVKGDTSGLGQVLTIKASYLLDYHIFS